MRTLGEINITLFISVPLWLFFLRLPVFYPHVSREYVCKFSPHKNEVRPRQREIERLPLAFSRSMSGVILMLAR